ncbi:MAG TPA: DNA polymerase III subunit alpha, partial [Dongiaceae bacterium]|nr:DNA polymerase III subunit alpha [Dongiaceae bacterium]
FWQLARSAGLAPSPGAEITHGPHAALVLPFDRRGWANLCRLLTLRMLDPHFDLVARLAELHDGLHVIVESTGLAASLAAAGMPAARGVMAGVPPRGTRAADGGLWLGLRGLATERAWLAERAAAARHLGIPMVATGDVAMLAATEHDAHRVAVTAAAGELLERMPPSAFVSRDAWLASPAEWTRRVRAVCAGAGRPELADTLLANNRELAGRQRLELELGTPIFPHAPVPEGETGPGHLLRLGREGVVRRYRDDVTRSRATRRLEHELGLIHQLGFTDYFLLVADIVGFARAHGIPTVGRGSGAGSIVAYTLGITNVDPLRYGLYFERFLHPQRRDCPDLDIDLCWQRRDEVIAHVYDTYGAEQVAMISTHATLGARSAFRETAKALGVSNRRVNALARRIPRAMERPYREQLRRVPAALDVDWDEPPLAEALRLAETLEGAPRHLSIHAGGVVIGDRPLTYYVPLERAAKGIVVTQFEMRAIEAIGLVKMDLLGNRALSEIGECVSLVRAHRGVTVDVDTLPDPDPRSGPVLAAGDTLNCFQLESPAMRHLMRMLAAETLDETIAAVALVRPGPAESGMKEAFCRRHRGLEPARFLHPRLEPVLGATHGVMLYEEDVMCVAAALAGLSLAEGDQLRRAIGASRDDQEFRSLERGFVGHCARAGVDAGTARAAWRELTRFAAYAFCKAHAAGYGVLAYQSAWLKTHYPAEWAVGVLNHHAGMYATWVHVEDLRRHGVRFLAPCVQRSQWQATLESGAVRVGLSRVFGLGEATGKRILAGRARRGFTGLADFADRARPTLPELEALILAGALDWTGRTRPSLLLEARVAASATGVVSRRANVRDTIETPALVTPDGAALKPEAVTPVATVELPAFDTAECVRSETRACGLWFAAHPLDVLVDPAVLAGVTPAAEIPGRARRRVSVAGLTCATRRVETREGGLMLFLTLADRTGLVECVLFPDAYRRYAAASRGQVVRVEGLVDETLGACTVNAERVTALPVASLGEALAGPYGAGAAMAHTGTG